MELELQVSTRAEPLRYSMKRDPTAMHPREQYGNQHKPPSGAPSDGRVCLLQRRESCALRLLERELHTGNGRSSWLFPLRSDPTPAIGGQWELDCIIIIIHYMPM